MAKKTQSKLKGKSVENMSGWGPLNNPMSGIFDMGGMSGIAAASQPFEMAANTSYNLVSLQRVMLSYSYVLFGPLRTLVDQPVYDAFRGGVKIRTDEVSPEEIEELHREIKRLKIIKKITDAMRWDRLFGGSGIIINVDQDYTKPLDIKTIKDSTKLDFIVADRWELAWNGLPGDPRSTFSFYGKKIDQSRVAKIIGEEPPSLVKQRLQGWGMSVIECVLRELNMYFKNNNVIFELLDEAKVDVWKIKGFNSQVLSQMAAGVTAKRIRMATQMKNFLNAITLDKEDDYEQKTMHFTGLGDMLEQIRIGIAAAVRMPMSKIFGLASSGFSSGEDDIANYNCIVEGQRDRARDALDVIMPIVCMKVWGFVPDDLDYEFAPLRVLTAEQEQNVLTQKFARHTQLYDKGIYNAQEYCEALKQDKILLMETDVAKGAEPEPPFQEQMGFGQEEDLKAEGKEKKQPSSGKEPKKEKV